MELQLLSHRARTSPLAATDLQDVIALIAGEIRRLG
jgi:hypothetical protein